MKSPRSSLGSRYSIAFILFLSCSMKEELSMIKKNQTWYLVERPQDINVIGVKWVYGTKLNVDGSINKHKERLVVKGYAQVF